MPGEVDLQQQEDDFDAAFAEFSGETAPNDVNAEQPEEYAGVKSEETQPEPEQPAAPAAAEATRDQPALTPEQIAHRQRSAEGRARAEFNRKQRELAEQAAKFIPQGQPENAQIDLSELDDLAPSIKEAFLALQQKVNQQSQALASLTQSQFVQVQANTQAEYQAAANRLEQLLPGWSRDVQSPAFKQWTSTLPPAVAALAQSDSEADVAYLVTQFRAATRPATPQPQPEIQQRQARLQQSALPMVRGARPAASQSIPDDFDGAFDFFARQRQSRG